MSMEEDDTNLGTILQCSAMPAASGMDALEVRLVVVQEVPSKTEVRFYAIRGGSREHLTAAKASAILRAHVPQKSISELSEFELIVMADVLLAEVNRMRPVYEAAKAWLATDDHDAPDSDTPNTEQLLILTIERAEIAERSSS